MTSAIEIADLSKRFRLNAGKVESLKERVIRFGRIPYRDFWALRDIDLVIDEGETFGLLGHNGSGKSTLLKCIAGILRPTTGSVRVRGRVASLLELGAGFHPDLTGRENIFINGSFLGIPQREIERRFDDIVGFAELEEFIDQQVKFYSSGMFVRLGFSVAVNVDPDVLLVDEVLAVGDENFYRKCIERVKLFQVEGRTIIVVTHSTDSVRQLCDRAAVLDHGKLVAVDVPALAIRIFREHLLEQQRERAAFDDQRRISAGVHPQESDLPEAGAEPADPHRESAVEITEVLIDHPQGASRAYLLPGEPLWIVLRYRAREPIRHPIAAVTVIDNRDGTEVFGTDSMSLGLELDLDTGEGEIVFALSAIPLLDGTYPVLVSLLSADRGSVYAWGRGDRFFEMMNPDKRTGRVAIDGTAFWRESTVAADADAEQSQPAR